MFVAGSRYTWGADGRTRSPIPRKEVEVTDHMQQRQRRDTAQ